MNYFPGSSPSSTTCFDCNVGFIHCDACWFTIFSDQKWNVERSAIHPYTEIWTDHKCQKRRGSWYKN